MADRSIVTILSLAASGNNVYDSPVIPSGKVLVLRKFGCADDGGGASGKATTFRIQFGKVGSFTDVRVAAVNGNTSEFFTNREFTSDGTQFFRITATNASTTTSRTCAWWVDGYDK